jgi:Transglutaminase-like superfamily
VTRRWRLRAQTAQAMALLCLARLLVAALPFRLWQASLGQAGLGQATNAMTPVRQIGAAERDRAWRLASHVERATFRLPFRVKCLPQAMVLVWLLRRRGIACSFILAVRPAAQRGADDDLHAWTECGGGVLIGELPGPWIVILRLENPVNPDKS